MFYKIFIKIHFFILQWKLYFHCDICVFSKGVSIRIFCTCTNICFSRRTKLAWHFPAQTLANNAATAFLTNTRGRGSCTDGSKRRHTRTSLPGHGLLLHSLLSDLSGHICCHTEWRLDFRSMHESVTDLKEMFSDLESIQSSKKYFTIL